MDIKRLQALVVDALEDVKAQEIAIFDTMHLTALFDRLAIASGTSNRQTKALAASVRDKVKSAGGQVISVEGEDTGEWVLVDLGDMIVHIMQPAIRAYYRLEEIWGDKPIKLADAKRGLKAKADADGESKPRRRRAASEDEATQGPAAAKPKRARKTAAASEESAAKPAVKPAVKRASKSTKTATGDAAKAPARKTASKTAGKTAAKSAGKSAKAPVGKTVKVAASKAAAKPARKSATSR